MFSSFRYLIVSLTLSLAVFAQTTNAQTIRPASDRLDAIVSYPLTIAIVSENERDLRKDIITKLDDGRVITSQPFWVGRTPQPSPSAWTPPAGIWTATDYETISQIPMNQRPRGTWFIRIALPIDAVGQGLWFGSQRYELNWLPDPERAKLEAITPTQQSELHSFWSLHLTANALADPAVQYAIDQYHHNPFSNWRAHLLTDGLAPSARTSSQGDHLETLELELAMNTPGADILREISHQSIARWQIILGRIWLIDPSVAIRLKSQLIATAQFNTRILPLWTLDNTDLAQLAHDLLSPFVDDRIRMLRAQAWLENQPRALAWITDDQGQIEADTNRFIPTITAIARPQTPGSSLMRVDATESTTSSPQLSTIAANIATPITIPIDPILLSPTNPNIETQPIRIRTGNWSTTLNAIASPTPARAPYVRIGPMLNDWTMNALLANRPLEGASPSLNRSSVGILRRVGAPTRSNPTTNWQLYMELTTPDPASSNESLTLWVGPYTNPFAVWTITPSGQVTFDAGSMLSIGIPRVQIRILDDRWIAMIDLPENAFDHDDILQLGLERTDASNTHTAWPRRMIPDQPEPGRLTIHADNFDQLK